MNMPIPSQCAALMLHAAAVRPHAPIMQYGVWQDCILGQARPVFRLLGRDGPNLGNTVVNIHPNRYFSSTNSNMFRCLYWSMKK